MVEWKLLIAIRYFNLSKVKLLEVALKGFSFLPNHQEEVISLFPYLPTTRELIDEYLSFGSDKLDKNILHII